jgi:hypothetical protein
MSYEPQFDRLRLYNIFMGFLHLVQALLIILLSNDFKLPVTTSFLTYQAGTGRLWPETASWSTCPSVSWWRCSCCFRRWPTLL